MTTAPIRYAIVFHTNVGRVQRYLPGNYVVVRPLQDGLLIAGRDRQGWTLDGYVIPRLASGLIAATETTIPADSPFSVDPSADRLTRPT